MKKNKIEITNSMNLDKLQFSLKLLKNNNDLKLKTFELTLLNNNENLVFKFSLQDENFDTIDEFSDFLLIKIGEGVQDINITIDNIDELNSIDKDLCNAFKEIWENDFKKIIKDINNC